MYTKYFVGCSSVIKILFCFLIIYIKLIGFEKFKYASNEERANLVSLKLFVFIFCNFHNVGQFVFKIEENNKP